MMMDFDCLFHFSMRKFKHHIKCNYTHLCTNEQSSTYMQYMPPTLFIVIHVNARCSLTEKRKCIQSAYKIKESTFIAISTQKIQIKWTGPMDHFDSINQKPFTILGIPPNLTKSISCMTSLLAIIMVSEIYTEHGCNVPVPRAKLRDDWTTAKYVVREGYFARFGFRLYCNSANVHDYSVSSFITHKKGKLYVVLIITLDLATTIWAFYRSISE